MTDKFVK